MISYALKIGTCIVALGIGSYLYFIAMSKCIKQNLFAVSQRCRLEIESEAERKLIWNQIIEYIEFDSSVKRLVENSQK